MVENKNLDEKLDCLNSAKDYNGENYSKEVYQDLDNLVKMYYETRKKQQSTQETTKKKQRKKLKEDKRELQTITNNIVYGYTDIFLEHYYWSRPLMKHYNNEAKKKVVTGPVLTKKRV